VGQHSYVVCLCQGHGQPVIIHAHAI
jgi:hypothetical protein